MDTPFLLIGLQYWGVCVNQRLSLGLRFVVAQFALTACRVSLMITCVQIGGWLPGGCFSFFVPISALGLPFMLRCIEGMNITALQAVVHPILSLNGCLHYGGSEVGVMCSDILIKPHSQKVTVSLSLGTVAFRILLPILQLQLWTQEKFKLLPQRQTVTSLFPSFSYEEFFTITLGATIFVALSLRCIARLCSKEETGKQRRKIGAELCTPATTAALLLP